MIGESSINEAHKTINSKQKSQVVLEIARLTRDFFVMGRGNELEREQWSIRLIREAESRLRQPFYNFNICYIRQIDVSGMGNDQLRHHSQFVGYTK
jgi:hypothetical protein